MTIPVPPSIGPEESVPSQQAHLYLDLMKRCLINSIHADWEYQVFRSPSPILSFIYKLFLTGIGMISGTPKPKLIVPSSYSSQQRYFGLGKPMMADTMIGLKRLDNIQYCVEDVLKNKIPGDLIETGVWRGGSVLFMRAILKAYGIGNRKVWAADSFEGLPKPDEVKYPQDKDSPLFSYDSLKVSLDLVRNNFRRYGLLDDQVIFLKGWFKDTLPHAPIDKIAVARLDGDMYESTMDSLKHLYPKISIGGYLIMDDYGSFPCCKEAVHDYRRKHHIQEKICLIDWTGIYWQKQKEV